LTSIEVSYVGLDGYHEIGGISTLGFASQDHTSIKGSLGFKAVRPLDASCPSGAKVFLQGRWVHEFGDRGTQVEARFTGYPSVVFLVSDEGVSRDSALVGAGLCAQLRRGSTLWLGYDVSLRQEEVTHVLSANVQYRW
jgi:outer membrane autotransporter protein